jgi:Putative beta-barrel porin-2, OmpL-like. bbp2
MKIYFCIVLLSVVAGQVRGQINVDSVMKVDSSLKAALKKRNLTLEGYVDVYYSYAASHPVGGTRPYVVNYGRDNEINLDLAYLSLKYTSDRIRAAFTPGFGTYMNANYSDERQTLENIVEAYIGVRLFKDKNIWLDGGVFSSPYTNESVFSFDQLTYTRSLGAENTPYYLTGAKLTVPLGPLWTLYLYLLNGWQVIQSQHDPLDGGSQVEYKPNDKWDVNWNTYIGNESSTTNPSYKRRFFTDGYVTYTPSAKWTFTADAYSGWQQAQENDAVKTRNWWNGNLCARYTFIPGNSISARVEHYDDPYEILEKPVTNAASFKLSSASLGYNLSITDDAMVRVEARYFKSPAGIYPLRNQTDADQDLWLTIGLTARLR